MSVSAFSISVSTQSVFASVSKLRPTSASWLTKLEISENENAVMVAKMPSVQKNFRLLNRWLVAMAVR